MGRAMLSWWEEQMRSRNLEFGRKAMIAVVCFFTIVSSLGIISNGVHLGTDTYCDKSLMTAFVIIGAVMGSVSLVGLVGLCFRVPKLFWVYMVVMSFMNLLFLTATVFALVVSSDAGAGRKLSDRDYAEYRLGDYSGWLRTRFIDDDNKWNKIQGCLIRKNVCKSTFTIYGTTPSFDEFRTMEFSSIQSGCCMPAHECNFEYVSPFVWNKPASLLNSTNADCGLWDNNATTLCFSCSSCKAGFIDKLNFEWNGVFVGNIMIFLLLLFFYCVGFGVLYSWAWERKELRATVELAASGTCFPALISC